MRTQPSRAQELGRLKRRLEGSQIRWKHAADFVEEEKSYRICVDVPGADPDEIKVTVEDNILKLSGRRIRQVSDDDYATD